MVQQQRRYGLPEVAGSAVGTVLAGLLRLRYGQMSPQEMAHHIAASMIERPSEDLLERALRRRWDVVYREKSGEFLVTLDPDEPGELALRITAGLEGSHHEYIAVRVFGDRVWPAEERDRLREACDDWTRSYRFPRLYTHRTQRGAIAVVAEGQLFVGDSGVHQALVEDHIAATVGNAARFWYWLLDADRPDRHWPGAEDTASAPRATVRDPMVDTLPPITDEDIRRLLGPEDGPERT